MYNKYTDELYLFDMHYRHYCDASQRAHVDILKSLDSAVEKCYANWYLDHLAKSWGDKLVAEDRFNAWQLTGIHNQYKFYKIRHFLQSRRAPKTGANIPESFAARVS